VYTYESTGHTFRLGLAANGRQSGQLRPLQVLTIRYIWLGNGDMGNEKECEEKIEWVAHVISVLIDER
jgi:hypothetical protein